MTNIENKPCPIRIIAARAGKLVLTQSGGGIEFVCENAAQVAEVVRKHGAHRPVLQSSSMDFDDTDGGFAQPGLARAMWDEGVRLSQVPATAVVADQTPRQPPSGRDASNMLRACAAALLAKAGELDGRKLFILTHENRFGAAVFYDWYDQSPTVEQVKATMAAEKCEFDDSEDSGESVDTNQVNAQDVARLCGAPSGIMDLFGAGLQTWAAGVAQSLEGSADEDPALDLAPAPRG